MDTIILIFCCIPNSGRMRLLGRGLDGTGKGIDLNIIILVHAE